MSKPTTYEDAAKAVMTYVKARDWHKNPPRGLAISIVLEATELLEYYQWQDESFGDKKDLGSEAADILIYLIQFAHHYDIDLPDEVMKKLAISEKKYPAEIFQIKDEVARNKAWLEAKLSYKKDTTL